MSITEEVRKMSDYVCRGNERGVEALLNEGANPNSVLQPYGWAPLHQAARDGKLSICRLLVHHGANVDQKDTTGQTPLHRAAHWGHSEIVKYLASVGADLFAVDSVNQIAEEVAFHSGHTEIFRFLLHLRIKETKKRDQRNSKQLQDMRKKAKKIQQMQEDIERKEKELNERNALLFTKKKEILRKISLFTVDGSDKEKVSKNLSYYQIKLRKIESEIIKNSEILEKAKAICFEKYSIEEKGDAWLDYISGKYF